MDIYVYWLKSALKNSWNHIKWIYFWRVLVIWNHCALGFRATLQSTAVFWVPLSSRVFFGMMISLLFQTFSVKLKHGKNEGNRLERCIPEIWKQLIRCSNVSSKTFWILLTIIKVVQAFRCTLELWKQLKI